MSDRLPSDGVPTDEQLRRIEHGVQRRIDLRRRVARRIAGGSIAVVLVVGGFALLKPLAGSSSSGGTAAGSAARSTSGEFAGAAAPAEGFQTVRCHGAVTTTVTVDQSALPGSATTACATAQRKATVQAGTDTGNASGSGQATPRPAPSGAVLCRATDGALSVWPGAASVCTEHGLRAYSG